MLLWIWRTATTLPSHHIFLHLAFWNCLSSIHLFDFTVLAFGPGGVYLHITDRDELLFLMTVDCVSRVGREGKDGGSVIIRAWRGRNYLLVRVYIWKLSVGWEETRWIDNEKHAQVQCEVTMIDRRRSATLLGDILKLLFLARALGISQNMRRW